MSKQMSKHQRQSSSLNKQNQLSIHFVIQLNITLQNTSTMKSSVTQKVENLKLKEKSEMITNITHASQRSYKLRETKCVKYLNIDYFKINPCSNTKPHPHKHCVNYHKAEDRKRFGTFFSDTLCEYIEQGKKCPKGDECPQAHSRVEQFYQHQTYKKKFCSHFPKNVAKCEYGDYCSFAHNQEEIRIDLIHNYKFDEDFYMFHYKTEFCPFNLTEHDKALCVYAHNLQDYRRNPTYYIYSPIPCYNWKLKDYIYDYSLGCENGVNCNMCHGWKELQYHPNHYRINKCLEGKCRKGECPNYHSEKEKRIIDEEVENSCFRYVAKNRIVEGVFKQQREECFLPRSSPKTHSLIDPIPRNGWASNDFSSPKTALKVEKQEEREEEPNHRYFLDQSPADSDNENNSEDSEIQNQVDKIMDGE